MSTDVVTPDPRLPEFRESPHQWTEASSSDGAGSSGSSKVEEVTLMGDPSGDGPYVQLLKVAPHAKIDAHHHVGDRAGTVLQGTWFFGYGEAFDEDALVELPVSSIYTEPSGVDHFAMTRDEAVVVQITGTGPTNTVYADPSLDPTKQ